MKKVVTFAAIMLMSLADSFASLVNYTKNKILANFESIELKLSNDVMIYENKLEKQQLTNLVDEFLLLWKDKGFVKVL